jgi:hypothetical protein
VSHSRRRLTTFGDRHRTPTLRNQPVPTLGDPDEPAAFNFGNQVGAWLEPIAIDEGPNPNDERLPPVGLLKSSLKMANPQRAVSPRQEPNDAVDISNELGAAAGETHSTLSIRFELLGLFRPRRCDQVREESTTVVESCSAHPAVVDPGSGPAEQARQS